MSLGARYLVAAVFLFTLMNAAVKALGEIPLFQIVLFRGAIASAMCAGYLLFNKTPLFGNNKRALLGRGIIGTASLVLFFLTIQAMPLASAVTLQYLSPLFSAIFAALILKERVSPLQMLAFLISFGGVILIKGFDGRISLLMLSLGILGASCSGLAYVLIGLLKESESPYVVVFYFAFCSLLLSLPIAYTHWVAPTLPQWILLVFIGLSGNFAQLLLTRAYQIENVAKISALIFLGSVFSLIIGALLFHELVPLEALLGIVLVIFGVTLSRRPTEPAIPPISR